MPVAARLLARPRAAFETLLIAGGFLVLFFALPHAIYGDDEVRFGDIEQLLHGGPIPSHRYSLVMPLLSTPFLLLGEVTHSPEWWAARFNVIVVATGTLAAFRLLRGRIDFGLLRRTVLVLLFASFLTNRLRDYNAEVLTATVTALGIVALATGRRAAGWALIVVGVVNTPAALLGLGLIAGAEAVRTRRLRCLLPIAVAAGLIMTEDWIRRGGPFVSGYEGDHGVTTILPYSGRPGFSYPFVLGVLVIVFSFGRGLLFFTPGLVFWLGAGMRTYLGAYRHAVLLMMMFVGGLVLLYAKWWAWYGGIGWGPRFFVFAAIPASLLLGVRIHRAGESTLADALTLPVLVLSAWVGASGAIADPHALDFCRQQNVSIEFLCWYSPEYSSLWYPFLKFPSLSASTTVVAAYCEIVFAYLAAPLVGSLVRAAGNARGASSWVAGWRL